MTNPSADPFVRNSVWVDDTRVTGSSELPSGVALNFHGRSAGNTVNLTRGAQYRGVIIDLSSAIGCRVTVGAIRVHFGGVRVSFVLNSGRCSSGSIVTIGDGCVFNGSTHVIGALTNDIAVRVGRDCLFASGISIRGSSHHGLWDRTTGVLLNPEQGIDIGDHVWIGDGVVILNKARIGRGSVVAARSVVNKPTAEDHVLLAGAPAAVRRSDIDWTHAFPLDNGGAARG